MNLLQRIWGRQKKRTLSGFEVNLRFSTYRTILRRNVYGCRAASAGGRWRISSENFSYSGV